MNLQVGTVYEHRRDGKRVVVGLHRTVDDPRGNGFDMGLAVPYGDWNFEHGEPEPWAHPFDVVILYAESPHHGEETWREVELCEYGCRRPADRCVYEEARDRYLENRRRDRGATV